MDTGNYYRDIGNAIAASVAIEDAFRLLLRLEFEGAKAALAEAQVRHFGMKDWRPRVPTRDVYGNGIVFKDSSGNRYAVPIVDEHTNSHIRVLQDASPNEGGQLRRFEAWGPTFQDARKIGNAFALEHAALEPKWGNNLRSGQWIVLKCEFTRPSLD